MTVAKMKDMFSRSAYLNERKITGTKTPAINTKEFNKWKRAIPERMLEKRLKMDRLTIEQLMQYIEEKDNPVVEKELPWTTVFEKVMYTYKSTPLDYTTFQALVDPFIQYAKKRLADALRHINTSLVNLETIIKSIANTLYERLHSMLMKCVILEVNIARKVGLLEGETGEERFQHFMRQFNEDHELRMEFFGNYPVLSRLMTESMQNTLDVTVELIQRFVKDHESIKYQFGNRLHRLERLKMGLGDTHQNGRTVALLEFETGNKLVYKPRQILIDKIFEALLSWLNGKGLQHPLQSAKSLDCRTYGWQEFVPYEKCTHEDEVRRFYYRQGAYTALFYILGSSDFHAENIIAHGEYPVPIDLETLFSRNLEMMKQLRVQSRLALELNDSVYSTLMLPLPSFEHSIIDFDLSALGAGQNQVSKKIKSLHLEGEGTDEIKMTRVPAKSGEYKNKPVFKGKTMSAFDYSAELETGFSDMYKLFLRHKEEFMSVDGPLQPYGKAHVRQVFRPTHVYMEFLHNSLHPDYVQNGLDRVQMFDILWQVTNQSSKFEELVKHETKDLLRHDVPYFYFTLNSRDLYDSNGHLISSFFSETGFESIFKRINKLSKTDLEKQTQYLRWSLASMLGDVWEFHQTVPTLPKRKGNLSPSSIIKEALELGRQLKDRAIIEDNLEVNWLGLNLNKETGVNVSVKSSDLYDGLLGYALFLAYLARETNNCQYEKLSRGAIKTVIRNAGDKPLNPSVSAFSGEGAFLYGLVHLGLLWNDRELIRRAKERLPSLHDIIRDEKNPDFSGGLAGFIVMSLNIYQETGDKDYLDMAQFAGDRLMQLLTEIDEGTGLAHGASGYAWALGSLGKVTGKKIYKDKTEKLLLYENTFYDPATGNWDSAAVSKNQKRKRVYWCHGAPGIALSRLMLKNTSNLELIAKDLDISLKTVICEGVIESHCLCHGTMGNADILLTASQELNDVKLEKKARDLVDIVLSQKKTYGWRFGLDPRAEMDGFMLGRTGIGYSLLRFKNPEIPSVLALELPKGGAVC